MRGLLVCDPSGCCGASEVRANVERLARNWKGQAAVRSRHLDAAAAQKCMEVSSASGALVNRHCSDFDGVDGGTTEASWPSFTP